MNNSFKGLMLAAVLLSGCTSQGMYNPPVVDRSGAYNSGTYNGATDSIGASGSRRTAPAEPVAVREVKEDPNVQVITIEEGPLTLEPSVPAAQQPKPDPVPPRFQQTSDIAPAQPTNPAVVALLDTAQQQSGAGRLKDAQNALERAQRIAPREPEVYYQLALVRQRMGQFLQAEQVALKGTAMANGQPKVLKRLWNLIAQIRQEAGNSQGAQQARAKAASY